MLTNPAPVTCLQGNVLVADHLIKNVLKARLWKRVVTGLAAAPPTDDKGRVKKRVKQDSGGRSLI